MCVVYVHICASACNCVCSGGQGRMSGILLYHSLPDILETGFPIESGARLKANKRQPSSCLQPPRHHGSRYVYSHDQLFLWVLGI